jgi:hypothetical protein
MIEAASGTPVIAYPSGSVSEMEYGVSGFLMGRIEARFTKLANMFQKSVPKMSLGFFKTASAHTAWHAITSPIYERLIGGESQALALSDGVSVG